MMAASTVNTSCASNSTNFDTLDEPVGSTSPTSSRKKHRDTLVFGERGFLTQGHGKRQENICTNSTRSLCKAAVLTPTDKQHNFNTLYSYKDKTD